MQREDYRATLVVGLGFLAATLTGFFRQIALARLLGVSRQADIYLVAFAVPEFFFIALPIILSPAFLPIFSKLRQAEGDAQAWQFAKTVLKILLLSLIALTFLAALLIPILLTLISPGFTSAEREQALALFFPMLPGILFMGIATLIAVILQVYRRFLQSVIITSIYNLVFIISLFILPFSQAVTQASWAVTFGAGAALLCVLPFWWRQIRVNVASNVQVSRSHVKDWEYFTIQLILGYGIHHMILFVDRAMATMLSPGSVAALSYADHLTLVIGQLSGLAVSTVLFPGLAEKVVSGDLKSAGQELADALTLVFQIALPATAGLILLRTPIVQVLFEHGAFDAQATSLVSAPILWYSIAVLADALCQPLWRVVYVKRSGWTVVAINGLQTTIRLVCNFLLIPWLGYIGLALSATIGLTVQVFALAWWTKSTYGFRFNANNWIKIIRTTIAVLFALLASCLLYNVAKSNSPIFIIFLCSLCGALVYILIIFLSKNVRRIFYGG
jgi:putative peptidoglycan lipid II flippase